MGNSELVEAAINAMKKAYAPYSGFKVGAAVETPNGSVYTGINIENISFPASVCAERTAIFKAVSEGNGVVCRIAVAGDSEKHVYPCGICRQVIWEFAKKDARIICANRNGNYRVYTVEELLPYAFENRF